MIKSHEGPMPIGDSPPEKWGRLIKVTNPRMGRCTLVLLLGAGDGTAAIICYGPKNHYRKAGGWWCIDQCLAAMTEEFRATMAVTVRPWGGKEGRGGDQGDDRPPAARRTGTH